MSKKNLTNNEKWGLRFFDEMEKELDILFPKLNQDDPTKASGNHRGEALVLNAVANNLFNEFLSDAIASAVKEAKQEILEDIGKEIKKMRKDRPGLAGLSAAWRAVKNNLTQP